MASWATERRPRSRRKGRAVAMLLTLAWVAAVVAIYFVIAELKRTGREGLKVGPNAPTVTTSSDR
ncbi:MAG: hypothetical protein IBJ11_05715 [Phycisphaerales bacterium]|nr:hypothetical protein [Phycisphaerales bacterium]